MRKLLLLISLLSCSLVHGQKVGLVLSGGGASAMAHVGVLKALDEHGIPIDAISGTSAGALIGALYASGYSPEEIEAVVTSDYFLDIAKGRESVDQSVRFYQQRADDGLVTVRFRKDSILTSFLPNSLIETDRLDLWMLEVLGRAGKAAHDDFDSLMIPFRCGASDIHKDRYQVFASGDLNLVVRASMSFPFYIPPVRIDGTLYFDGGLYNNFPSDVMCQEFAPEVVIGSNVSSNDPPPSEVNTISQLTNMVTHSTDFRIPCNGVLIQPKSSTTTFDFEKEKVIQAIDSGYHATLAKMDSIKMFIKDRISSEQITSMRKDFRARSEVELWIDTVTVSGLSASAGKYVVRHLIRSSKHELVSLEKMKARISRLQQDEHFDRMEPRFFSSSDSTYGLHLHIVEAREFSAEFGGHFSSRPVNTGFIQVGYQHVSVAALNLRANSYFGNFYGSVSAEGELTIPGVVPFRIRPWFTMNRWDHFRSFATFFEDVKPSFLNREEIHYGTAVDLPTSRQSMVTMDMRIGELKDDYFFEDSHTDLDTADLNGFDFAKIGVKFDLDRRNRAQWASAGNSFYASLDYVWGTEKNTPGSSNPTRLPTKHEHSWIEAYVHFSQYLFKGTPYRMGVDVQGFYSTQKFFADHQSSMLMTRAYTPLPDARTLWLPGFRGNNFVAAGASQIFTFRDQVDLRLEAYYFQPIRPIGRDDLGNAVYEPFLWRQNFMASSSLIYHSIIGPVRLTVNYFHGEDHPWLFQFSYGLVLFNRTALRD